MTGTASLAIGTFSFFFFSWVTSGVFILGTFSAGRFSSSFFLVSPELGSLICSPTSSSLNSKSTASEEVFDNSSSDASSVELSP